MRVTTSGEPPAADGMMSRIGRSGYSACALPAAPSNESTPIDNIILFMTFPFFRCKTAVTGQGARRVIFQPPSTRE